MRLTSTLSRLAGDVGLRVRLLLCQAEASMGTNSGNTAVITVGAFAVLFVLAVISSEQHPQVEQQTCTQAPARATGARQQVDEELESPGPHVVGSHCVPWV